MLGCCKRLSLSKTTSRGNSSSSEKTRFSTFTAKSWPVRVLRQRNTALKVPSPMRRSGLSLILYVCERGRKGGRGKVGERERKNENSRQVEQSGQVEPTAVTRTAHNKRRHGQTHEVRSLLEGPERGLFPSGRDRTNI